MTINSLKCQNVQLYVLKQIKYDYFFNKYTKKWNINSKYILYYTLKCAFKMISLKNTNGYKMYK